MAYVPDIWRHLLDVLYQQRYGIALPHSPTNKVHQLAEPDPSPWHAISPDPVPWSVAFLVAAVTSKEAAASMANKEAAQQIVAAANEKILAFIDSDDICPRWPLPGPPPWLSVIASELTLVANTLQEGSVRTGILQVAGQVLDRAQAITAQASPTALHAHSAGRA